MRTTIDIEEDVLTAVKDLARREGRSAGAVLSRLAREALTGLVGSAAKPRRPKGTVSVGGFEPFPSRGFVVTNELVNRLRDIEGV